MQPESNPAHDPQTEGDREIVSLVAVDPAIRAGDQLRTAREARKLSVVDVARALNLSTNQIRDLERGSGESFHNAELRRRLGGRYCDLLELPRALVAVSPRPNAPLRIAGQPVRLGSASPRRGRGHWALLALVLLIGYLTMRQFGDEWSDSLRGMAAGRPAASNAELPPRAPAPSAAPVLSPVAPSFPTGSAPGSAPGSAALAAAPLGPKAPTANAAAQNGVTPGGLAPSAHLASGPAQSQTNAQAPTPGRFRISAVTDRCWVEVQHDAGRVSRVLERGESIDLPAVGLHRVLVGNRSAITATLDGRPLDLRPTGGVTARYDAPAGSR
jgi:cytoskeleton protein RodZ